MDDEARIRKLVARMLRAEGHEVDVAADGDRALELHAEAAESGRPYQLLVLDLTVPGGMGGQRLLDTIRSAHPGVRALAMSGYTESSVTGFAGFLAKPFGRPALLAAIRLALAQ